MSIEWIGRKRSRARDIGISLYTYGVGISFKSLAAMGSPEYVRVGRNGTALVIEPCDGAERDSRKVGPTGLVRSVMLRAKFDAPNGRYAATIDDNGRLTAVLS